MKSISFAVLAASLFFAAMPANAQGTDQTSSNQDTAIKTQEGTASTLPGPGGAAERRAVQQEDRAGQPATPSR